MANDAPGPEELSDIAAHVRRVSIHHQDMTFTIDVCEDFLQELNDADLASGLVDVVDGLTRLG